jgi:hypothetical protein
LERHYRSEPRRGENRSEREELLPVGHHLVQGRCPNAGRRWTGGYLSPVDGRGNSRGFCPRYTCSESPRSQADKLIVSLLIAWSIRALPSPSGREASAPTCTIPARLLGSDYWPCANYIGAVRLTEAKTYFRQSCRSDSVSVLAGQAKPIVDRRRGAAPVAGWFSYSGIPV